SRRDDAARSHLKVAGLSLVAGMASGFFGIGGGFLIVPCLLFATAMPMIDAVGSSLLAVSAFSVTTAANYARSGLVAWPIAGLFVLGGIGGGFGGMRLAVRLCAQKDRLRRLFAVLVLAIAAYVIWRSLAAILRG
ncbi:MAG: sulfite exporter TauE/SafE family protein, partial [Caulobacteraceae bacterium]|nr:sulfite exporter TauE/SafE family protein [Caulobacter sp.]